MIKMNRKRKSFWNIITITLCVLVSILLPLIIQSPLNRLFRNLYNPPGWIVLQPHLRVISTLLCIVITYGIGFYCLVLANSKRWLFILHAILTILWCGFIAVLLWLTL